MDSLFGASLFEHIAANAFFKSTPILVVFTKADIFAEKLSRSPFQKYFPEYTGPNNYSQVLEWIQSQFKRKFDTTTDGTHVRHTYNSLVVGFFQEQEPQVIKQSKLFADLTEQIPCLIPELLTIIGSYAMGVETVSTFIPMIQQILQTTGIKPQKTRRQDCKI
jgi:hypothetical protein